MNFSKLKYWLVIPAAVFVCLPAASLIWAQNRSSVVIRSNSDDAFLGISMEDVTGSNMSGYKLTDEKGVIVRSVQEESPAEEAGLRENDIILEFAGQPVWSSRQFSRLVSETPVGRKVAITVSRDGKRMNLSATIRQRRERDAGNRGYQRFFEGIPGDQIERFFEIIPDGQSRSPRNPGQSRPDGRGSRQNSERSEQKPRLGVETQALTEQMAEYLGVPGKKGALIASVLDGSASEGKLRAGDVVIGVNDREVTGPSDLTRLIRDASGETTVRVIRDKKQISVKVSLPADEDQGGGGYRL